MSLPTPKQPEVAEPFAPIPAGLASELRGRLNERIQTAHRFAQSAVAFLESLATQFGNGQVQGGDVTPGDGLSVAVSALDAVAGTWVHSGEAQVVGGFLPTTVHSLWLRQDATFTVTPEDEPPSTDDGHGGYAEWAKVATDEDSVTDITDRRVPFGKPLVTSMALSLDGGSVSGPVTIMSGGGDGGVLLAASEAALVPPGLGLVRLCAIWDGANDSSLSVWAISGETGVATKLFDMDGLSHVLASTGGAGAPASGAWVTGQLLQDTSGRVWVCTVGGEPGTWALVGNGATTWLALTGGTMAGNIAMGGSKVTGLGAAASATDAPNAGQVVQRLCGVGSGSQGANNTRYYGFGGIRPETTEANAELKLYDAAGVMKNLRIYVTTNTLTTTAVFTVRKNGADTGITISVGAGTTGEKSDTTNTASFAAGDTICIKLVTQPDGINSIAWTAMQLDLALA